MRFAIVLMSGCLLAGATSANGQAAPPAAPSSTETQTPTAQSPPATPQQPQPATQPASSNNASPSAATTSSRAFACPHPADPHRRQHGCNHEDFDWDETLEGGWDKVRQAIRKTGINPTASYTGALQTNVTGGDHQVWSYAGLLSFGASANFEELTRIPGLSAYVGASWGTGGNLAASINSAIPTSILYAPSFYLGEMYLQEQLANKKLTLLAGRISASNGFASLPVFTNYITFGIDTNPFSIGANDIAFNSPPPGTQWGAQATYEVTSAVQVAAGMFNTNLNSANGQSHGTDFALQEGNKGALVIAEVDYLLNQGSDAKRMPGQITAGFLHSSNAFPKQSNPLENSQGYSGAYVMAQQMVYRPDGPGTTRGATAWAAWAYNASPVISVIPEFWSAGLSYVGLIPVRKKDIVSAGFVQAEASKFAPLINGERVFELNYQWVHSKFFTITPHLQHLWIRENHRNRDATVLGIQLTITL